MKVYFSELAESKLIALTRYLLEEWSEKSEMILLINLVQKSNRLLRNQKVVPNQNFLEDFINVS